MSEELWTRVDRYFTDLLLGDDPVLDAALKSSEDAGLPAIQVSATQGRLLNQVATLIGARRILEVGTLGGYSTIWLARALGEGGRMITLEFSPKHAEVARANIERAGLSSKVEVRVGAASETMPALIAARDEPFDLVFLDADKISYPKYLEWSLDLTKPGSVIIADNVVRGGAVVEPGGDENVLGTKKFLEMLSKEKRLQSTAIQTVGIKGYDGFSLSIVR